MGSLWDITELDSDRFCVEFLTKFLSNNKNLKKSSLESRKYFFFNLLSRDCKLKFLNGCTFVIYGIPQQNLF